jgi:hypothetical protein
MRRLFLLVILTACATLPAIKPPSSFLSVPKRPQLMFLGTFHFSDAGLDSYKPKYDVNIKAADRQQQVAQVVNRLAAFRPTKVALEFRPEDEERINAKYRDYLAGKSPLGSNEIYQIGFRLAKQLGHTKVYGIDAGGRNYFTDDEWNAKMKELGGDARMQGDPWAERYKQLYEYDDRLKTTLPLAGFLRYLNSAERVRVGHGSYLTGRFHVSRGSDYFGPDNLSGWWYDRNLRIFENIARLIESPDNRVLVLIGAGHLPILLHAAQSSPEIELVDIRRYL